MERKRNSKSVFTTNFELIKNLERWEPLNIVFNSVGCKYGGSALAEYLDFANNLLKNHGERTTVKILKEINSLARMFVSGYPKDPKGTFGGVWFRTHKPSGLPSRLKILRKILKEDPRNGLLITNLVTLFRVEPVIDLSTIEGPFSGNPSQEVISDFTKFLKELNIKIEVKPTQLYPSTRSGPNGPIAILSVSHDAEALQLDPVKEQFFIDRCLLHGCSELLDTYLKFRVSKLEASKDLIAKEAAPSLGIIKQAKLAGLSDKAGKTRIIYILNWWHQNLLLPLHEALMSYFKELAQDATWDQGSAVEDIRKWTEEGKTLYSYDLTAATDRWPRWHQKLVLEHLVSPEWAVTFDEVLSSVKAYSPEHKREVTYVVGQPMGSFSSWAALNISHHMIMRYLSARLNVQPLYRVLGDDIVIADVTLAKAYEGFVTKELGVTISALKSVVNKLGGVSSAEFAKHILVNGKNLTPVSPNLLKEIYIDYQWWKMPDLFLELRNTYSVCLTKREEEIIVPTLITSLLAPLKRYYDDIIALLTSPVSPYELESYDSNLHGDIACHRVQANPWKGYGPGVAESAVRDFLVERIQETAHKLLTLKSGLLDGGAGTKAPGYLLELPDHPVWVVLKNLDSEIKEVCGQLDRMEARSRREANRLLVDIGLLEYTLLSYKGGLSPKAWMSRKAYRAKGASLIVKKVLKSLKDGSYLESYNEW
jgi:hypothetical protein